jgi:hypothetical protein
MRGEMMTKYFMKARLRSQTLMNKSSNLHKRSRKWSSKRWFIIKRRLRMRFKSKGIFRISLNVHTNINKSFL